MGTLRGVIVAALVGSAALLSPLAAAETKEEHGVRVSVDGRLLPKKLPRHGTAPVSVSVSGRIGSKASSPPPQLEKLTIAINRHGRLSSRGLPRCRIGHIDPSTTREAMAACAPALVGDGTFSANVRLPEQSPFPSNGKVLAFNGKLNGRPAIFAHIYGTDPVPTSYVLPFFIKSSRGTFGTVLETSLPRVTGEWGFVTGISMTLDRRFTVGGKQRSFIRAGCPAPDGFALANFPLMRTSFGFEGGVKVTSTVNRVCKVGG
jgi:hypothetical protein